MTTDNLKKGYSSAVVGPEFFSRFGTAVNSFKSLLIYGAPGKGKTFLAEQLIKVDSEPISIPCVIWVGGQFMKVFDLALPPEDRGRARERLGPNG